MGHIKSYKRVKNDQHTLITYAYILNITVSMTVTTMSMTMTMTITKTYTFFLDHLNHYLVTSCFYS